MAGRSRLDRQRRWVGGGQQPQRGLPGDGGEAVTADMASADGHKVHVAAGDQLSDM